MPTFAPHPSVVRFLKEFRPRMEIVYNPAWEDPEMRFFICEPMRVFDEVDEENRVYVAREELYPVRWMKQASEIDQRYISSLWESLQNRKSSAQIHKEHRDATQRQFENNCQDWARFEGYGMMKKIADQYNFSGFGRSDPTRKRKMLEDRFGRAPKV